MSPVQPLPVVFMFSGLGSQYPQMGRELYDGNERFKWHLDRVEELARDAVRLSVLAILYSRRSLPEPVDDDLMSAATILAIELALARLLIEAGIVPATVLGSSLGVLAACVISGSLDEREAFKLVYSQQEMLREMCDAGRMITVLDDPAVYHRSEVLSRLSEIAAINYRTGFVIALPEVHFKEVRATLEKDGHFYQVLPVWRAYHSRWIDEARQPLASMMGEFKFSRPRVPIICCSRACRIESMDSGACWHAIRGRLRFHDTVSDMEMAGRRYRYIDVGPSGTMANFLKYCLTPRSGSVVHSILSPFKRGCENLAALMESV